MTSPVLWSLIAVQIVMGAFDTLYHHELTERLAWRTTQAHELALHGTRNLLYGALFLALGWTEPHGLFAVVIFAVLVAELIITLMDFVEEDRSRKLPSTERVTHTLLAMNYGAILALLFPALVVWMGQSTAVVHAYHGVWSIVCGVSALGVVVSGVRDFAACFRLPQLARGDAKDLVQALPHRQTILVTGATGFIGRRLVEALAAGEHDAIVLTRDAAKAADLPAPFRLVTSLDQISSETRIDAIVNLAGESISDGLWTTRKRAKIVDSRRSTTAQLVQLIERLQIRPSVLINGSAIGWYGLRGDEMLTEESSSMPCFSHSVCAAWEAEAGRARRLGVRVVLLRIGLVLGTDGGMLARLLAPFEFGMGGPIGTGRQWMSWIERDDLVRLIAHTIVEPWLRGPVNATAPAPVENLTFAKELGIALHRPAFLRVPATPLRLVGGDFARELLLGGQRVLPRKALASGFVFRHTTLPDALRGMLAADVAPVAHSEKRTA